MSDVTAAEKRAAAEQAAAEKRAAAEQAAAEKRAAAEQAAAEAAGVTLTRGEETVTAHKPSTVTSLKSQGWKVAEQ